MCFELFAILSPHDGEMGILYPEKRLLYLFGAKSAQNGPFLAVFWEFLRREGPKRPENLVERSLYPYGPSAFDRLRF